MQKGKLSRFRLRFFYFDPIHFLSLTPGSTSTCSWFKTSLGWRFCTHKGITDNKSKNWYDFQYICIMADIYVKLPQQNLPYTPLFYIKSVSILSKSFHASFLWFIIFWKWMCHKIAMLELNWLINEKNNYLTCNWHILNYCAFSFSQVLFLSYREWQVFREQITPNYLPFRFLLYAFS